VVNVLTPMCLVVFAWQTHPRFPLVVAANRDEWRARPTAALARWSDLPVIAGRDLQAGGTWMGVGRGGRFAALTNVREPSQPRAGAPSRGNLVVDCLQDTRKPAAQLAALAPLAPAYQGFNLLVADDTSLGYYGSQRAEIVDVAAGVHGLSNHRLNEPWPKVRRATAALARAIEAETPDVEALFELLADAEPAPDTELPDTGVGLELERKLAPVLLVGPGYGTRCSTVMLRHASGRIELHERTRDEAGRVVGRVVIDVPAAG